MQQNRLFLLIAILFIGGLFLYGFFVTSPRPPHRRPEGVTSPGNRRVEKTDADWKQILTRSQYNITRESGTEWPNSSDLTHEHRVGIYSCVSCHNPLFLPTEIPSVYRCQNQRWLIRYRCLLVHHPEYMVSDRLTDPQRAAPW